MLLTIAGTGRGSGANGTTHPRPEQSTSLHSASVGNFSSHHFDAEGGPMEDEDPSSHDTFVQAVPSGAMNSPLGGAGTNPGGATGVLTDFHLLGALLGGARVGETSPSRQDAIPEGAPQVSRTLSPLSSDSPCTTYFYSPPLVLDRPVPVQVPVPVPMPTPVPLPMPFPVEKVVHVPFLVERVVHVPVYVPVHFPPTAPYWEPLSGSGSPPISIADTEFPPQIEWRPTSAMSPQRHPLALEWHSGATAGPAEYPTC